jgi:ribosome-associated translation inhibitor RaiA
MADALGEGLTFEKVWAMFQETDKKFQETDRQFKETNLRFKETDRRIGELSNRFGELAEHLVAPSIKEKFNALGYDFDKTSQNVGISDALDRYTGAEIDILLENGDIAIAIEVKAKPLYKDIDRHLERMEVLRRWADKHSDKRKFRAAVAGAIMTDEIRKYAVKTGFYVIEQTGDTVKIDIPEGFTPREW